MRVALRAGLTVLAAVQILLAGWIVVAPQRFFDHWWVSMGMDYNVHLLLDYAACTAALGVLLAAAALRPARRPVRVALVSYLVYTVGHVLVHAAHHGNLTSGRLTLLLAGLALNAAIPLALLAVTLAPTATDAPD